MVTCVEPFHSPPLQATRQPHSTGRSKLNTGPCGSSLALQPLGAHPWCWFSRGVSPRQSKRYGMQGEEGKCGKARIRNLRRWERTQSALNECGRGESRRVEGREREDAAKWRVCRESGCIGLTDRREQGAASREEHNEEAALAERLRPITQLLPLFSISTLLFPLGFVLSSHFPSSRTFSIAALNIQVLSTATDPLMIPVGTGRFYLPALQ